jgi:tetratricopeptide (TPR) repeat protein
MADEEEEITEEVPGETLAERFGNIEQLIEDNQKAVLAGGAVVAALVVAVIYVFVSYLPQENAKAQKAIYMAEFAFAKDSFALALNGNPTYKGFTYVADKYSWTKTGNLANYYAGICCLNLKRYAEAIKYLDKFSTDDAIIGAIKLSATGDAYAESGKMDEAIKYYEKAANYSDNESYTPYFLLKTGEAYEKQKRFADAKKEYEKIRDQYPTSDEGRDIEKYIARAGAAVQ